MHSFEIIKYRTFNEIKNIDLVIDTSLEHESFKEKLKQADISQLCNQIRSFIGYYDEDFKFPVSF